MRDKISYIVILVIRSYEVPMLAVRLPTEIEDRLTTLAKITGRPKSYYVREALLEHLDDMEDLYLSEQRLIDIRAGRAETYSLEEVERRLGLED